MVRGLMPSLRPVSLLEAPADDLLEHLALARGQPLGAWKACTSPRWAVRL